MHHREEAARGLAAERGPAAGRPVRAPTLEPGEALEVSAWAGDLAAPPPPAAQVVDAARPRDRRRGRRGAPTTVDAALALAADAFVVRHRGRRPDVVAGYPWFGAWSRDTMISYEGLFLATGRADEGRELLRGVRRRRCPRGCSPTPPTPGTVEYNTADATLWFLHAVDRHVAATGDDDLAAELVDPLDEVIDAPPGRHPVRHPGRPGRRPAHPGRRRLRADLDGRGGRRASPVTPRRGQGGRAQRAVDQRRSPRSAGAARRGSAATGADLDALRATGDARRSGAGSPPRAAGCYDVVDAPRTAATTRRCAPTSCSRTACRTPRCAATTRRRCARSRRPCSPRSGLRTLAPARPGVPGRAPGRPGRPRPRLPPGHRLAVADRPVRRRRPRAVGLPTDGLLDGLVAHLGEWGLGSVSETADGDAPHDATGCPFQAWSVAETLRVLLGVALGGYR